jgi:hypothetical protein
VAADQLYKVAYDEAVRALSEQQATIESVRTRTGLLLSDAAVTTSAFFQVASGFLTIEVVLWIAAIASDL